MKKIIIIFITIIVVVLIYVDKEQSEDIIIIPDTAIRLRIIPNSNSLVDQNMKNKVKKYLEDNIYLLLKNKLDIEEARNIIKKSIPDIEKEIKEIFIENNYNEKYKVEYGNNYFPKKEYRGVKYNEGYYESMVVSIGNAEGDNWWCVLFPNLCLIDLEKKEGAEYKFWISEVIKNIQKK